VKENLDTDHIEDGRTEGEAHAKPESDLSIPIICPHCGYYNNNAKQEIFSLICNQCLKAFNNDNAIGAFLDSLKEVTNNEDVILTIKYCTYKKYIMAFIKMLFVLILIKTIPLMAQKYSYDIVYLSIKLMSLAVVICLIGYSSFLTITFKAIFVYKDKIIKESYLLKSRKIYFDQASFIKMMGTLYFYNKLDSNTFFRNGVGLENYLIDEETKEKLSVLLRHISGRPTSTFYKHIIKLDNFIGKEAG